MTPPPARLPFPLFSTEITPHDYETHLSAIQAHAQTAIWVSRPHEDQERACHSLASPPARPQASAAEGCRNPLRASHPGLIDPDPSESPEPLPNEGAADPAASGAGAGDAPDDLIEELLDDEEAGASSGGEMVPLERFRFPKAARLTEASEFSRVKQAGKSYHGRYMIMGVYRDRPSTRFGLITSRRVGNAVVRNRLRRRLRETLRLAQSGIVPGVWIVLVVRAAAGTVKTDALRSEFVALGNKAAIFIRK